VEAAYPLVRRWALVHLGDPSDADDLTQDVLVRMIRRLDTFSGQAQFATWLYSMTRNAATDRLRRGQRRKRLLDEAGGHSDLLPARSADPSGEVERRELRDMLDVFFDELPPRQREAFALVELEGLSAVEAGERLDLEPVSVRAHLFKARRRLRSLILATRPDILEDLA
jgi:RNA polymerase sigma-70 factor (ECF subfamily)